ncbi:MAG: heme ABC exporter ATP-binding protein CcmA [Wenzhouxiangellaceae bacterium]
MTTLLTAREVVFERRFISIFGTLNLQVQSGEAIWITGINGAGKTTLLKVLAGIYQPEQGAIDRADCCFVGHQPGLKSDLTAAENLRFDAALRGHGKADWHSALTAFDGLYLATQTVAEMSAGQRRRVALARLLLGPEPLWLLDEPYANLDDVGCRQVDEVLKDHLTHGGAVILASHGQAPCGLPTLKQLQLPLQADSHANEVDQAGAC